MSRSLHHPKLSPTPRGASGGGPAKNDYSQHYIDTHARPQNFIRDQTVSQGFAEYPRLARLLVAKDEMVSRRATAPLTLKADLKTLDLKAALGSKFDVILIDPPWEEYARRAAHVLGPGGRHIDVWTYQEIEALKIEEIADSPSFVFLWCGSGGRMAEERDRGLHVDDGRRLLKKWGFRRSEDICWLKTNKAGTQNTPSATCGLLAHTKEHCLMGIKGDVRRSRDGHIIHANVHTDVIVAEQPLDPLSTEKPEELYTIIEHFCLGRRRLELFGMDHNVRQGWVTVGNELSSSNYEASSFQAMMNEAGTHPDGSPCPGHLVGSTREIEDLRPKTPPPPQTPPASQGPGPIGRMGAPSADMVHPFDQVVTVEGDQGPPMFPPRMEEGIFLAPMGYGRSSGRGFPTGDAMGAGPWSMGNPASRFPYS